MTSAWITENLHKHTCKQVFFVVFSSLFFIFHLELRVCSGTNLQPVVFVLQVFDAESLGFDLLSQQRRVDHLDA